MSTKQVRVEIPSEIYNTLTIEQEIRRKKTNKIHSLSSIVLDYCSNWARAKENPNFSQALGQFDTIVTEQKNKPIPMKIEDLLKWEERLRKWENEIRGSVFTLVEKDQTASEKIEQALVIKEKALDLKEAAQKVHINVELQKNVNTLLNNEIKEKNEQIYYLKNENHILHKDIISMLRKIDHQTEKSLFMDYIVPFLPVIAVWISSAIIDKNQKGKANLDPLQKKIFDIYDDLKPEDKSGLKDLVDDFFKNTNGAKKAKTQK